MQTATKNITKKLNENMKITGKMIASIYDTSSPQAELIEQKITNLINSPHVHGYAEKYKALIAELRALCLVREYEVNNIIVTVGRAVVADRLANDTTYTGIINYGALGSSSAAVANGDTTLTTEVFRKVTASTSTTNNIAFIDFFYSKADTDGTYEEFGTFIDGTASVDTGQMWTHALTGGWVKTSSESMTVSCQYTIS